MHALKREVEAIIRHVAATVVLPHFRKLSLSEIGEKTPGEVVTIADLRSEAALRRMLTPLISGARVVGEEGCTDDPAQLLDIGQGSVWIVDPIDGTANFAAGQAPFGIIVAFARDGVTEAGWIYDPLSDRMCYAERGGGSFINDERLICRVEPSTRPVAALATQFMKADLQARMLGRAAELFDLVPIPKCAAEHYARLALCENHVAVFQRTLPWDHAAGVLFLTEAGGRVSRWDGTDYTVSDNGMGIIAASNEALWEIAKRALVLDECELARTHDLVPQQWDTRLESA